jgi:uncharacterized protein YjbI with pentapeptide repeats
MDLMKFMLQTVKLVGIAVCVGGVFVGLWCFQQVNVNALGKKINLLEQKIGQMSSVDEQVKLEKDILVVEKDKTTIQNGVYTTLVQALGGLILSVTAYVGYRNLKVAEDKQVTERFSKAIEHLGSDGEEKIHIRLGGIYALEQIAKDSPQNYHWTIVEILSAFIREKQSINLLAKSDGELRSLPSHAPIFKVPVDVRTALTVLGNRNIKEDPEGKIIDLKRVILTRVDIQKSQFPKADFSGAYLQNANLDGANFSEANLSNANLLGSNIIDADLTKSRLAGAILHGSSLNNSKFNKANFIGTELGGSDLRGADLYGSKLIGADLSGANLSNANLSKTHLGDANLQSTNLSGTDLRGASLCGSITNTLNMLGLEFSNDSYIEAKNLTREQIDSARKDKYTKLPAYLNPPMES